MLQKLIEAALAEVGYTESSDNLTKYGEAYGWNGVAWCVIFIWYICNKVGITFPKVAHCNQVEAYAKSVGRWVTANYQPGDLVIWDYDADGSRDHIGLVIEVSWGQLITVEGNYSDKVAKVTRTTSGIVGAYRPDYGEATPAEEPATEPQDTAEEPQSTAAHELPILCKGDVGEAVGSLQSLLRYHGYRMRDSFITVTMPDCEFGNETEQALYDLTGSRTTTPEAWAVLIGGLG